MAVENTVQDVGGLLNRTDSEGSTSSTSSNVTASTDDSLFGMEGLGDRRSSIASSAFGEVEVLAGSEHPKDTVQTQNVDRPALLSRATIKANEDPTPSEQDSSTSGAATPSAILGLTEQYSSELRLNQHSAAQLSRGSSTPGSSRTLSSSTMTPSSSFTSDAPPASGSTRSHLAPPSAQAGKLASPASTPSAGFPWNSSRSTKRRVENNALLSTPSAIFSGSPGDECSPERPVSGDRTVIGTGSDDVKSSTLKNPQRTSSPAQSLHHTNAAGDSSSPMLLSSSPVPLSGAGLSSLRNEPSTSNASSTSHARLSSSRSSASSSRPSSLDAHSAENSSIRTSSTSPSYYTSSLRQQATSDDRPSSSSSMKAFDPMMLASNAAGTSSGLSGSSRDGRNSQSSSHSGSSRPWVKDSDASSIRSSGGSSSTGSNEENLDSMAVMSPAAPPPVPFLSTGPQPPGCRIQVESYPDKFDVIATLPGFTLENITLALKRNGSLHILADRYDDVSTASSMTPTAHRGSPDSTASFASSVGGHYERMVELGDSAIGAQVSAEFDGKRLKVTVQKRDAVKRSQQQQYHAKHRSLHTSSSRSALSASGSTNSLSTSRPHSAGDRLYFGQ